jgi:hypothetical protein
MQFKEHDKVVIKLSETNSITGEIVHASEALKHYYVSAGAHSGYYEEHELSALYPLQKGVTYFNIDPLKLRQEQYKTFAEEIEEWAKVTDTVKPGTSATGSLRYNNGKVQTREIDPSFILGIGEVLTKSREKYPEMNWALPTKLSTPYESLQRHLLQFWSGEDFDKDSGKHHLLHVATNVMFLYYHVMNSPEGDDRAFKKKETK